MSQVGCGEWGSALGVATSMTLYAGHAHRGAAGPPPHPHDRISCIHWHCCHACASPAATSQPARTSGPTLHTPDVVVTSAPAGCITFSFEPAYLFGVPTMMIATQTQVFVTYVPGVNGFFHMTGSMDGIQWARVVVCTAIVFVLVEVEKALVDPLLMPILRPVLAWLEDHTPDFLSVKQSAKSLKGGCVRCTRGCVPKGKSEQEQPKSPQPRGRSLSSGKPAPSAAGLSPIYSGVVLGGSGTAAAAAMAAPPLGGRGAAEPAAPQAGAGAVAATVTPHGTGGDNC